MRLSDLSPGDSALVSDFDAELEPDTVARFRALGLLEGARVRVDRRLRFGGPFVLVVGGGAFALERQAAEKILVSRDPPL